MTQTEIEAGTAKTSSPNGAAFDRVADALWQVAERQLGRERSETMDVIALLEAERTVVLANGDEGTRSHGELDDAVWELLSRNARYAAIEAERNLRNEGMTHAI
jgi:hypothetical protein